MKLKLRLELSMYKPIPITNSTRVIIHFGSWKEVTAFCARIANTMVAIITISIASSTGVENYVTQTSIFQSVQ